MNEKVLTKTVYEDMLGQIFDKKADAERSNHQIHLDFRQYIAEELLVTFSDNRIDKLKTTKELWTALEFTPKCIREISEMMNK